VIWDCKFLEIIFTISSIKKWCQPFTWTGDIIPNHQTTSWNF
jgi:hypothetical protein